MHYWLLFPLAHFLISQSKIHNACYVLVIHYYIHKKSFLYYYSYVFKPQLLPSSLISKIVYIGRIK